MPPCRKYLFIRSRRFLQSQCRSFHIFYESQMRLNTRPESTPLILGEKGSSLDLAINSLYFIAKRPGDITMADIQARRKHINTLTKEQVSKFLSVTYSEFPEYYPLLLCAFRTGMRLGELLGLGWEDINFDGNFIEVKRSYTL